MAFGHRAAGFAIALACILGAAGCSAGMDAGAVRFAVPSSTAALAAAKPIETHAARVLATSFDVRQPVFVQRVGDAVEVTYGVRGRDGVTVRLDARTLRQVDEPTPYVYPRCTARRLSTLLARDVAHVSTDANDEVTLFTSEEHNRAFARVGEGKAVPLSPEGMQIVGPARANTDGRDIVAVFVAASDDGFALFAASLGVGGQR